MSKWSGWLRALLLYRALRLEFNELAERECTAADDIGVDECLHNLGAEHRELYRKWWIQSHATGELSGTPVLEAINYRLKFLEARISQPKVHDIAGLLPRLVILLERGAQLIVMLHPALQDMLELRQLPDLSEVQNVIQRITRAGSREYTHVRRARPKIFRDIDDAEAQSLEQLDRKLAFAGPVQQLGMVQKMTVILSKRHHGLRSSFLD